MKYLKTFGFLAVCFSLVLGVAHPLHAATYFAGEHYTLPADQRSDNNLYTVGSDSQILGSVNGDAYTAGGKILITGAVSGDIAAAGGTIDILSPVSGDVRVVGGNVTIGNSINGDVVIAGGQVHILAGSVIKGDVLVAGGTASLNGAVQGNVKVMGGTVALEGPIAGNVDVHANEKLTYASTATIGGYFHYTSPNSVTIRDGAVRGEVKYTPPKEPSKGLVAAVGVFLGILFLIKLGGLILGSVLAVTVFPKYSASVMHRAIERFGTALLLGFAVLVAVPVLCLILTVTIIGLIPALVILLGYILLLIVSSIYSGILVGAFLSNWWKKEIRVNWKWAVLGTVVLMMIRFLPILGGIACFIFFTASLGALVHRGNSWWKTRNSGSVIEPVL